MATIGCLLIGTVHASDAGCGQCHPEKVNAWNASRHVSIACSTCHDGAGDHGVNPAKLPRVHFDMELCGTCHPDQYDSFRADMPGKTYYGGSDGSPTPPKGWSKTADFPWWNVLIDGHPFVLETYEDRAMRWNQIGHQETIRPGAEACVECHGTKVATFTDAVDPLRPYQVKTVVRLPDGRIYTSYEYPGATATGVDPDPVKRAEARQWIYSALEALAFDELEYTLGAEPFTGSGYNWPSIEAGELCNQCHDPHSGKLRIMKKSLIEGIARNGINPYSATKSQVRDFNQASRQDQIIAVCAQCHSEYVGGYSAVDGINRDFFPWAKPAETEALYARLFGYNQDWLHGVGVRPGQNSIPNARGYNPDPNLALYPIYETLIKSQHPEAEVFWNSKMYNGGMCGGGTSGGCDSGGMGGGGVVAGAAGAAGA